MRCLVSPLASVCVLVLMLGSAEAANRTVCASGCQYTNLQTAINDAVAGDTILLRAGQTFVGNFTLKAKSTSSTAYITIRSDSPDSSMPGPSERLVPPGRPGANVASGALARLVGQGGGWKSTPVLRAEPGSHHYRLQFIEIDGTANVGYETLMSIGENTSAQTTTAAAPHDFIVDRVYLHGHATKGMKRGIALNSRSTDILNSYFADIKSLADAQAIGIFNGAGPFHIYNNYLEATAENILSGGADPKTPNLVPSDIDIRWNHFYKDPEWRNAILATPSKPTVSARTGGSLAAGTHYFKVVAVMPTGGSDALSAPSAEASVTVAASGAVSLSWSAVPGADVYRIFRGTSANGESKYLQTSGTSFTYTGASELSATPKSSGSRWVAKNLLELKNAQRVTIDGNLFENNWQGFQNGYAVLFTPKNQEHTAPWTIVKDVTFTNNVMRHVASAINISGFDWESSTQQGQNFTIANNLFYDIAPEYGNSGKFMLIASQPKNITFDHNTVIQDGTLLEVEGPAVTGFVFTNNFARHNQYGIKGQSHATGSDTLNFYFPGAVFRGNVLAGGIASQWPAGNFFPTAAVFDASFVNPAAGDYSLIATSPYKTVAVDGSPAGIDAAALDAAQAGAVAGEGPPPPPEPPPSSGELPTDWVSEDIGSVGTPGSAAFDAGVFTVTGAGLDVWGTADAFHYAHTTLDGDGAIVARVASVNGTDAWTKVGVMIRASNAANAPQASMFVSLGKGFAFQRRLLSGAQSVHTSGGTGTAPRWVRLERHGSIITASISSNGTSWTIVGSDTIALPATALVGLAVTSRSTAALASGRFESVEITAGSALPAGWRSDDIGSVGVAGSAAAVAGTFTIKGAGADVWGTADALQFASQTLDGDGDIVARVASISGTQAWTKVGVMLRLTLDAGSAQAFMLVSSSRGAAFQRRTLTGGTSVSTAASVAAPKWVKLSRRGQVISASISGDGATWTVVGSDTFSMVGPIQAGLAVSSHDPARLATATFDNVSVTPVP